MSTLKSASEVIYGLICVIGLLGNGLVVYVIIQVMRQKARTSTTIRCILHLAIADLITALGLPLLITTLAKDYWPFGDFMCRAYMSSAALSEFAKAFLLTLLGLFGYAMHQGTVFELSYTKITLLLSSCWLLGLAVATFLFATATEGHCNVLWPEHIYGSDAFVLIYAICVFLLPMAILVMLFRKRNIQPFPGEDVLLINQTIELVFVLAGVHLLLLLPHLLGQLVLNYTKTAPGYTPNWKTTVALISGWIWTSSCAVFPVLYHYFSHEFSEGLKAAIDASFRWKERYSMVRSNGKPSGSAG